MSLDSFSSTVALKQLVWSKSNDFGFLWSSTCFQVRPTVLRDLPLLIEMAEGLIWLDADHFDVAVDLRVLLMLGSVLLSPKFLEGLVWLNAYCGRWEIGRLSSSFVLPNF